MSMVLPTIAGRKLETRAFCERIYYTYRSWIKRAKIKNTGENLTLLLASERGPESHVEPTMSWRTSMDEICAFVATTFTRQSGEQPRNVQDRYAVAVKKKRKHHRPEFAHYLLLLLRGASFCRLPSEPPCSAMACEGTDIEPLGSGGQLQREGFIAVQQSHAFSNSIDTLNVNCERSELSGLFNARIFYIRPAVRRAVNVLNVSTCI